MPTLNFGDLPPISELAEIFPEEESLYHQEMKWKRKCVADILRQETGIDAVLAAAVLADPGATNLVFNGR